MGASERRPAAHVFVPGLAASQPVQLDDEDFHHLARVLRLRPGEVVSASDGAGSACPFFWTGAPLLEPAGEAFFVPRPSPEITVAFALSKGQHPEWAVQKLTEAGVDRVVVMTTSRCVARWSPADGPRRLARLREVARQAAMQSRRVWLPSIEGPHPFAEVLSASRAATRAGAGLALAVPGGAPLSLATPMVLIGPEGGWANDELDAVSAHASLGPHILRAETAAVAAGVLLAALRAGLVTEART